MNAFCFYIHAIVNLDFLTGGWILVLAILFIAIVLILMQALHIKENDKKIAY